MVSFGQESTTFLFHLHVKSNTIAKGHLKNGANVDKRVQVLCLFLLFKEPHHISFF